MTALKAEPLATVQSNDMFALADRLRMLKAQKEDLEEQLKTLNARIEETDQALVEQMVNEEMPSFSRAGKTFCLTSRTFAGVKEGKREALFSWLRENGFGDLVKPTVNANSLSAFAKEQMEDTGELPAGLKDLINVFVKTTVNIRAR